MTEAEGIQQQTIDQLSMAIKKQQAKNAALVGEAELLRTQFCALEDEHKGKLHEMSTTIQETERDVDLLKQQLQSTEQVFSLSHTALLRALS